MTAWLYLIGNPKLPLTIKIGITNKLSRRLTEISTGNPEKLGILHKWVFSDMAEARMIEKKSHTRLAGCRLNGEWFSIDLKAAIEAVNTIINEPELTQVNNNERILRVAELKAQIKDIREEGNTIRKKMSELREQLNLLQKDFENNLTQEGILDDELRLIDY